MTKNIAATSWGPFTATGTGDTYNSWEPDGPVPTLIFSDDFASGDLSKTGNGFSWSTGTETAVTADNPDTGTYSLRFNFQYAQLAEQRFALGALYPELTIIFRVYIPDGTEGFHANELIYDHYNSEGGASDNNKWTRVFDDQTESGNPEKVGVSTRAADALGISKQTAEWNDGEGGGLTAHGSADNFINAGDRGSYFTFKIYHKAATVADNDGVMKFYKDDVLIFSQTDISNYDAGGDHAYSRGILLGSMSGRLPLAGDYLILFLDNVEFWEGAV